MNLETSDQGQIDSLVGQGQIRLFLSLNAPNEKVKITQHEQQIEVVRGRQS